MCDKSNYYASNACLSLTSPTHCFTRTPLLPLPDLFLTFQNRGGNIEADCLECFCDLAGSLGPLCDPSTGQCQCRAGVTGVNCSQCLPEHYGFGQDEGCVGEYPAAAGASLCQMSPWETGGCGVTGGLGWSGGHRMWR